MLELSSGPAMHLIGLDVSVCPLSSNVVIVINGQLYLQKD